MTPTPAEPRNSVISLKSLLSDYMAQTQEPETVKATVENVEEPIKSEIKEIEIEKEFEMDELEMKTLIETSVKSAAEQAAVEASARAIEEYQKSLPALKEVSVVSDPDEKPFKSFGEQLQAVMGVATRSATEEQVNKLEAVKATGLSEGVPADGGFLVQSDIAAGLLKPIYELGAIASRVDKIPVGANSNGMIFNAVDETARTSGSRYGAVQAYWLAEAGTKTASKPKFRQMELKLKKLIGLCYATDELLQDATALAAVVSEGFRNEFTFMVEDAVINGNGVGKPLGILNANATVSVAKESGQAADTILAENIFKMWARLAAPYRNDAVWLINQDVEPQLFGMYLAVGTGGVPVYLPANGLSGSPFGTMLGRPVISNEYCATVGDTGDIILANLGAYQMIDKGGIQEAQSIHINFTTDETAFRFVYRADGQPKWASAVTPAKGSNSVSPFVKLDERA
jgi:HK97 family phage major capsid protein